MMNYMQNYRGRLVLGFACIAILAISASCSDDDDDGPVTPLIPSKLAFLAQPGDVANGAVMSPSPSVAIQDAGGATVTTSSDTVTIALATNPGGATLGGTLARTAVNGIATFDNLTLDENGEGYTLTASSTGLTGTTSVAFDVSDVAPIPTSVTVTTDGIAFVSVLNGSQDPAIDTLKVGGTVTWTSLGASHLVESVGSPSFTSQSSPASTYGPITLSSVGTYQYQCITHGGDMFGRVVVVP